MCLRRTEPFCPSPDQHRLQERVRPQPGAATAARPALPPLHRRIGLRRNEVTNPPACIRHLSPTPTPPFSPSLQTPPSSLAAGSLPVSERLHGTVSETISSPNPKKSGRKNFTLAGDPNSKPPPPSPSPQTQPPARRQSASTDGRRLGLQREEARRRSLAHCHCHSVSLQCRVEPTEAPRFM